MRWMITGASGQLGSNVIERLHGMDVVALSRADLDITARDDVDAAIATCRPDVVINAAAYTAVDAAETDEKTAYLTNAVAPELLATALARHGGRLIHISTDYVFDGTASSPYEPDDPVGPQTAYGRTKLAGEQAIASVLPDAGYVVRTAWVYGGPGPNFLDTMLRLEKEREFIDVVADQIGSPTWAGDLAAALISLGNVAASSTADVPAGITHFVNAGQASWYDLTREIFALADADPDRVRAVGSAEFARAAKRPAWSVLSTQSWTDRDLPAPRDWRAALSACMRGRT